MNIFRYDAYIDADNQIYLKESGSYKIDGRKVYNNPADLADFFGDVIGIRNAAEEHVYIACLDVRLHLTGCFEASHGNVISSMMSVREILQKSLLLNAVSIIISHNHPSGDYTPSDADRQATTALKNACEICGLQLVDHIIVAANNYSYYSFQERQEI